MVGESLTFACPVCQTRLTIPAQLAGVIGPCPTCSTRIQAPQLPTAPQAPPADPHDYQQPPAPAYASPQPQAPAEPSPLPPAPRQQSQRVSSIETNIGRHQYQPAGEPAPPITRSRPTHGEIHARSHRRGRRTILRFLIFPFLLLLLAGIVFSVLFILKSMEKEHPSAKIPPREPAKISSETSVPAAKPPVVPSPLPLNPPDHPDLAPIDPEAGPVIQPKRPGDVAREIVERFCQAKNLQERLTLIETTESMEDLAKTPLAGPLPFTASIDFLSQETIKNENLTEFYFKVVFKELNGRENPQTILVRKRSDSEPKVVVAPFLDLYGGRLAAFLAKPVNTGAQFHAVVYVVGSCTDKDIPDRENKFTLRLLAVDGGNEIGRAYFGKNSKIGEMLSDGTYNFKYGEPLPCVVYLTWNTSAPKPYLEALQLNKSLNWNL